MAEVETSNIYDDNAEYSFDSLVCGKCNDEFTHEKTAKLLHCLHTFCDACLESHAKSSNEESGTQENGEAETKLTCPECKTVYTEDQVAVNPFVNIPKKLEPRTEDGSPSESKFPVCTSCDDNQRASSFCVECEECLCDQCVNAHKRVKLTKDHTITSQGQLDQVQDSASKDAKQRQMYCKIHKLETLKLFCLTCEALTCRDCQLHEHKDHKYQFIEQTIDFQKSALRDGISLLKNRLTGNKELSEKMSEKEKDIKKQQVEVFNEVRQVADTITNELISWCKQLLNFLQGVCHGRMRDLSYKKKEVDTFAKKASHTIKFVEAALASGDDLSVLYAKSFMSKNISTLQDQNINVPNSMFDLNIKYENDAKFLTRNVSKMGFINVNGKSYPQQPPQNSTDSNTSAAGSTGQNLPIENLPKNVAEFLARFPPQARERYLGLPEEKRKPFLQQLLIQQQKTAKQQQQASQAAAGTQNGGRPSQFHTDSGAIQDLYGTGNLHPPGPPPLQHVRPRNFFPEGGRVHTMIKQQLMSQPLQQQRPVQPQGASFQQWRGSTPHGGLSNPGLGFPSGLLGQMGSAASQSLQTLMQLTNSGSNPLQAGFHSNAGQGQNSNRPKPQGPVVGQIPNSTNFISKDKLPPGRIDLIDPLNLRGQSQDRGLRIKQEPRETRENPSCQFAKVPPSPTSSSSTIPFGNSQGFSGSQGFSVSDFTVLQSPPPNQQASPSLTPSPCHSDGAPANSASPATTDINVMDNDRDELLKGLTQPGSQQVQKDYLQPNHDPNDPSEDYCRVCHNGGDLLCCEKCPKVFHLQCHIPAVTNTIDSSEVWCCTMCIPDEELIIQTPIPREFEINSNGKRKAPSGLVDKEIKTCERVLLELFCVESSTVFHEPVPKSVPNYHKVIQRPMDFATIKCKLRRGHFAHYNTVEEFLSDVQLVFRNCYKFNPDTSEVYQVGKAVEQYFESLVRHFLPCYLPHLFRRSRTPSPSPSQLDSNGNEEPHSRTKKRRSPAPDTHSTAEQLHFM